MWGFRLHWEKAPIGTDTFSVWEPKCLYIKSVEESSSSNPSSKYLMVLFCCVDDGCHPGVKIWTHPTPTLFTWFGIFRLLTQPQEKKKRRSSMAAIFTVTMTLLWNHFWRSNTSTSTKNGYICTTTVETMLKINVLGFLTLTPSTLGH